MIGKYHPSTNHFFI